MVHFAFGAFWRHKRRGKTELGSKSGLMREGGTACSGMMYSWMGTLVDTRGLDGVCGVELRARWMHADYTYYGYEYEYEHEHEMPKSKILTKIKYSIRIERDLDQNVLICQSGTRTAIACPA